MQSRRAIAIVALLLLAGCNTFDTNKKGGSTFPLPLHSDTYLQQSPIRADQVNVRNKNNNDVGYLRADPMGRDRINVYNKNGNQTGYLQPSPLNKGRMVYKKK